MQSTEDITLHDDGEFILFRRVAADDQSPALVLSPTATIGAAVEQIDLVTVIRVSQAVSGEIVLDKLIDNLMRIALEHAGAERGLLILRRGDELRIEAEATTGHDAITVRLLGKSPTPSEIPDAVLNYVLRTKESVILDDASASNQFSADPYIGQKHPRSLLCLPLVKQGMLAGVLYLENNVASHVFTPAGIEVLKLLASRAAISLENAYLYDDLQKENLERVRAEEAVRAGKARFEGILEIAEDAIISVDSDQHIIIFNQGAEKIFGYTQAEIIGSPLDLLLPRRFEGVHRKHIEEFARSPEVARTMGHRREVSGRRKDGSEFPAEASISKLDLGGELVFTVILRDITERKRAEEKIRQDEREFRQIVEAIPMLIIVLSPDGSYLYANERVLEYTGYTQGDVVAGDFGARVFHPDDVERLRDERQQALARGVPFEMEQRVRRKDGQYRWFLTHLNPMKDEPGQVIRWYVTGTDIHDRKQAEERVQNENLALREEIDKTSMFEEIVGASPALQTVLLRVAKVAPTDSTVLITGETGTGKELIARAIHKRSQRAERAFVSVNCAAIPPSLIASELFGHEKGAFTGATQRHPGRFEQAEGGTIFLDEIGELPVETQIALLRVLQEREFERVGGTKSIPTDVRVIAATNRDLQAAIESGTFRSELFYRLNVFPLELPSLRARKEDISLLAEYFIDRFAREMGKKFRGINKKTLDMLESYTWPGNIRELQNVIERSVIICETENFTVDESWLSEKFDQTQPSNQLPLKMSAGQEKKVIEAALAETRGRVSGPSGAAVRLGLPSSTLDSKIKKLKITKHRFKTD